METIPSSLLKGKSLHCQPIDDGPIVKAQIIPSGAEQTPTFNVVIVCPARQPRSKCQLRVKTAKGDGFCHYYKGDSRGEYQIIGPGMDRKRDGGYT